jgi:hypothetical protein
MIRPVFITASNLDDAWFQVLSNIFQHGRKYKITEGSYKGAYRIALDYCAGVIQYPHDRPLAPIIPPTCSIAPPTTEDDIEQYFIEYLMSGTPKNGEHYTYGTFIVGGEYQFPEIPAKFSPSEITLHHYGRDVDVPNQLEWVIHHFTYAGYGNEHCYIQVGYPESSFWYEYEYSSEADRKTSPCLRGLDFRVIEHEDGEKELMTHIIYRSWDAVAGFPVNMGGFTLLNEYVADKIGVNPGPLAFSCKSLHAYDFYMEFLTCRLGK